MERPFVLVAEDDSSVRTTIEVVLELEGFEVEVAEDGEEALEIVRRRIPDIVLLDQIMPRMNGKEVLAALRGDEATRGVPVVVLTGMSQGTPEDWPDAHFVGKPFDPEELVEQIRSLL